MQRAPVLGGHCHCSPALPQLSCEAGIEVICPVPLTGGGGASGPHLRVTEYPETAGWCYNNFLSPHLREVLGSNIKEMEGLSAAAHTCNPKH